MIARYVTPWKFRREQLREQRIAELRTRDGDSCRRCRRAIRFDLQEGHDKGAAIECLFGGSGGPEQTIDNLCLCHRRCNADAIDNTVEVTERVRRKNEAALFGAPRKKRARG
jgi:hypothetical protein